MPPCHTEVRKPHLFQAATTFIIYRKIERGVTGFEDKCQGFFVTDNHQSAQQAHLLTIDLINEK